MSETRVSQSIIFVGDDVDTVGLDTTNDGLTVGLGKAAVLNLEGADQAMLDQLAVVFAKAASVNRSRSLQQVA